MFLVSFYKFIFFLMLLIIMMNFMFFFNMNISMMYCLNEMFLFSNFSFVFFFDFYSLMFLFIVLLVVFNVFNFMNVYMNNNKNFLCFFFFTCMFVFSMILLVFSFNLLTMILGWEGLGVSSFYLIFFYNNNDSWKSSMKTFLNNKFGDSMILISLVLMMLNLNMKFFIFIFILSLFTKSAQYPFMSWLPMAMAAPTPISAMVHSSTLVTAGLFVIFRYFFFINSLFNLIIFMDLCLLSMFFSSFKAFIEKDMKKMIALSTLSQIGLMMYFMLLNFKNFSFLYMCNHALFKSLMFINMGYMMISNFSSQFNFNMNLLKINSLFNISFKLSCMNLMNLTFFSSFFIKETLLNQLYFINYSNFKMFLFFFSSFFTMNYSLKLLMFSVNNNFKSKIFKNMVFNFNYFSFFLMNVFSIVFMKLMIYNFLLNIHLNILLMFLYLIMLMLNFFLIKLNYSMIVLMMYTNLLIYIFPMNLLKTNLDYLELWMEVLTLNVLKFFSNNSFMNIMNMNIKMSILFMSLILFM